MAFSNFSSALQVVDFAFNLPGMVTVVIDLIRKIMGNEEHGRRLLKLAEQLMDNLPSDVMRGAPTASSPHLTYEGLQSVIEDLRSIKERRLRNPGILGKAFTAQDEHSKLQQIEQKLLSLTTQVVVVNIVGDTVPTICNKNVELPPSQVGLDRATAVLEFLGSSQGQDFRVIAIHGQPGVGKTTLLKSIWKTISSRKHFQAKAFVQIGHNATDRTICDSQSSICWQLGATNKIFPSHDFGREELSEHFKKLKTQGKPLFLAIDNVFNKEDLESLLPSKVGRANLPTSSCIALTCRNYRIVEVLLGICGLQKSNHSQVFKFEPPCLSDEESREVFVECAGMDHSASERHKELLDALVPLCGGLPLALTVLGTVFREEAKRENEQWRDIQGQWRSFNDLDDEDSAPVIKAVRLSFEMLGKSHQQAFLEMVSTFYGWRWDHVESIVGVTVMRALKNSALVWKVDHVEMCNQGALREGRSLVDQLGIVDWFPYGSGVVSMHDLTLRFGERTIGDNKPLVILGTASGNDLLDVSKLRHLIISNQPLRFYDEGFVQSLQSAKCLQSLVLCQGSPFQEWQNEREFRLIRATDGNEIADLHSLNLYGMSSSQRIMRMVQVSCLRVLILCRCSDLVQLPAITPLDLLEYLHIRNCPLFQGFSASCLRAWRNLKLLELIECPKITTLPPELGASVIITSLTRLNLYQCNNLMELPQQLGGLFSLKKLELSDCKKLERLPDSLGSLTSLEELDLQFCESLIELPQQIGGLRSLRVLWLSFCTELERLPDSLGSLTSLEELKLWGCESLIELPQQIGGLCSLKELELSGCKKLERLPDSLGSLTSLEVLNLWGCESRIELPQQIGGLCSLKRLWLSDLERLPDSLGSLTSLEELNGAKVKIGGLCSLNKLQVKDGKELERLPEPSTSALLNLL